MDVSLQPVQDTLMKLTIAYMTLEHEVYEIRDLLIQNTISFVVAKEKLLLAQGRFEETMQRLRT